MSSNIRILLLIVALCLYISIFYVFKKGRISFKYFMIWLVPSTIIFLLSVVPSLLEWIAYLIGMQAMSNLVIGMLFVCLFFILIMNTIIISNQTKKIELLIQELSILKQKSKNISKQE